MKTKLFLVLMLPMLTAINGCAEVNSKFDCPMKPGISCESLDQVNARVDRGEIGHSAVQTANLHASTRYSSQRIPGSFKGEPLRYNETVQRIWIAPFEDTAGNYHQESEVYTVSKPSHWIGNPRKEINADQE
jgi:conjugal transfer pilus assembly protein TraV